MPGQTFPLEVNPTIPERLSRLNDLAANLRFTWHRPTRALFASLDSDLWKRVSGNPRLFLRCVDQGALDQAAVDPTFLGEFQKAISSFDAYLTAPLPPNAAALEQGDLVAYFCAEYGFHESFPIYSGGLGILAGDHCKAASDLGLSFIAVGLLYRQGYFTQTVDASGNQVPVNRDFAYEDLPVVPATDPKGNEVRVSVRFPGRDVHARVWIASVGRIKVVLLDTNLPENSEADCEITHKLYGGDEQTRIQQEMILGLGGVKALRAIGLKPTVWHMNEGHAAFLTLELMGELVDGGLEFPAALEAVAAQCAFTTHTPVAAGHDVFGRDLALSHFEDYVRRLKVSTDDFLRLGRAGDDHGRFNMTQLALTLSRHQNGVSRIHGGVSAQICAAAWPEVPPEDNPIGYVTNGVHVPTFLFQQWKDQFQLRLGQVWRNRQNDTAFWQKIFDIPDASFWEIRQTIKSSMLDAVAARLRREHTRNRISEAHLKRMTRWLDPSNPNVLTIGFARRFAEYKRASLLFRDPAWLKSIVSDPDRPVVFLFAGKAHPRDDRGQRILKEVYAMANSPDFLGRVVFVEDYDMGLARSLVAGVDVWLNNPVYPLEASGTSGMKAAINGTINLSVLDGWWAEAYDGENGWAIPSSGDTDDQRRDAEDSRTLYEILQDHVVPLYYDRSDRGLPRGWIAKSKRSMATNIPAFNMHRVLEDYVRGVYRPAAAVGNRLASDALAPARRLAAWKDQVRRVWPGVKLSSTMSCPTRIDFGKRLGLKVSAQLNGLMPKDARVEMVLTRQLPDGLHETPPLRSFTEEGRDRVRGGKQQAVLPFIFTGDTDADGAQVYEIDCLPPWCGQLTCEARVVPHHDLLSHPYEMGLMKWL